MEQTTEQTTGQTTDRKLAAIRKINNIIHISSWIS